MSSKNLCEALSDIGKRLCTEEVNPLYLQPYNSSRLIPLDKAPGIRPIGIGETLRRIIGKSIMTLLKYDITESAGPLQVCAGQEGGCEAAIHAMKKAFKTNECDAVLLVDATNAFNNLNRKVALQNIKILCPELSLFLQNIYQTPSTLFVNNSKQHLLSKEGTTQGENAAMAFYAISTVPLIRSLSCETLREENLKQAWFADDSSAAGTLRYQY